MIGIGIPAHNEAALLPRCLRAVQRCAAHAALAGEPVAVVVVLDSCSDASAAICAAHGVETLALDVRNVGIARAAAAACLLARGARWLACTDADSRVAPDWLAAQLAEQADAVCGTVSVDDWRDWPRGTRALFERGYTDADRHRHVHGANLGVSAAAYARAGGFAPLACSEDVALVDMLVSTGSHVVWSAAPRVVTSGRRVARADGGFAAALARLGCAGDSADSGATGNMGNMGDMSDRTPAARGERGQARRDRDRDRDRNETGRTTQQDSACE